MTRIDFTPLYRSSIGFDRLASFLDTALQSAPTTNGYPAYDIEVRDENTYSITLAVAGFDQEDLDIQVEKGVLTVTGKKEAGQEERQYLYKGITNHAFERQFDLADYVQVTGADLNNGLLTIQLVKEVPEAMKPKKIAINRTDHVIENKSGKSEAA